MKVFFIYCLLDPIDNAIRYVGYSCNPEKRYIAHILQSSSCRTHKECWIAGLRQQALFPRLSIRCVVEGAEEAKRIETALITLLKDRGIDLVNGTRGGDGSAGFKWSVANYEKHKAYWTEETRKRHGERNRGIPLSAEHIKAVVEANTPELLARRGAAIKEGWARRNGAPTKKKGKPSGRQPSLGHRWQVSEESKENYRKSWTPERRATHSERMRERRKAELPIIELKRQLARAEARLAELKAACK